MPASSAPPAACTSTRRRCRREREHQQQDDERRAARARYSVWRMTVSCSTANTDAPTIGPVSVWMPPEQHHHQAVDRAADRDGLGRDRALGEGEQSAGESADAAGDGESRSSARA